MLLYKFIIFQYTNDGFVLKQTRSCLGKVSVIYNRFKKDYRGVLFLFFCILKTQNSTAK